METTFTAQPDFGSETAQAMGLVMLGKLHTPLSKSEQEELTAKEGIIQKCVGAFWMAGEALTQIHDKKLWRVGYTSFKAYCLGRWGFNSDHAVHHMGAAEVIRVLTIGKFDPLPENERQVRPLVPLLKIETKDLKGMKDADRAVILGQRRMEAGGRVIKAYEKAVEIRGPGQIPSGADVAKAVAIVAPGKVTTKKVAPMPAPPELKDKFVAAWLYFLSQFEDHERDRIIPLIRSNLKALTGQFRSKRHRRRGGFK